jgi:hypothetical protein
MGYVNYAIATGGGQDGDAPLPGYKMSVYQSKDGYEYFRYRKAAQARPRPRLPPPRLPQLETVERMIEGTAVPYKMPRRARKPKSPLKLTAEERRLYNIVMEEKNAIRRAAYALSAPKPCKGDKVRAGKQGLKGRKLLRCVKPKPPKKARKPKKPKTTKRATAAQTMAAIASML